MICHAADAHIRTSQRLPKLLNCKINPITQFAEAAHHEQELHRAAANLLDAIPGIEVRGYFVDFEGIWDAELGLEAPVPGEAVA